MRTIEVRIPEDVASKIERAAEQRGVSVEELVRSSLEEKLVRDAEFDDVAGRVLSKNAELYKRLS